MGIKDCSEISLEANLSKFIDKLQQNGYFEGVEKDSKCKLLM